MSKCALTPLGERELIVRWLRAAAESRGCRDALRRAAEEIERGDRLAAPGGEAREGVPAKRYLPWAYAGGPSECAHGYAKRIACPRCDAEARDADADVDADEARRHEAALVDLHDRLTNDRFGTPERDLAYAHQLVRHALWPDSAPWPQSPFEEQVAAGLGQGRDESQGGGGPLPPRATVGGFQAAQDAGSRRPPGSLTARETRARLGFPPLTPEQEQANFAHNLGVPPEAQGGLDECGTRGCACGRPDCDVCGRDTKPASKQVAKMLREGPPQSEAQGGAWECGQTVDPFNKLKCVRPAGHSGGCCIYRIDDQMSEPRRPPMTAEAQGGACLYCAGTRRIHDGAQTRVCPSCDGTGNSHRRSPGEPAK